MNRLKPPAPGAHRSAILLLLAFGIVSSAQVARDAGHITGVVRSTVTGDAVAGAAVEVRTLGRTPVRSAQTGEAGEFLLPLLPPGDYILTVTDPVAQVGTNVQLAVRVGQATDVLVRLGPAPPEFTADVRTSVLGIDVMQTQQAGVIGPTAIRELPINRRNYLDFATLLPGVVDASELVDQADFRVPLTPGSGISFSGNNGRGNSFLVDGISINGASFNVRPSLPQVGVAEFQVNRNSYSAELGGSSGGVVNIVSRAGGDAWHGDVFGYLRHRSLQARNYFDPTKSGYTRVQTGAAASGPLQKDRTFLYAAFEHLTSNESVPVTILHTPTSLSALPLWQTELLTFFERAGVPELSAVGSQLRAALTPSVNPQLVSLFERDSGVFPFSARIDQGMVRLDHIRGAHLAFARFNGTTDRSDNNRLGALVGRSNGSSSRWLDGTAVLGDTWSISPRAVSLTRLAVAYSRFRILPNDSVGPELVVAGYGTFGRNSLFPLDQKERSLQLLQTFQLMSGSHSIKAGLDLNSVLNTSDITSYLSGRFLFGEFIPLSALLDLQTAGVSDRLAQVMNAFGQGGLAASLQRPITSLQAFSLGVPAAYIQGFGNSGYTAWRHNHAVFAEDSIAVTRSLRVSAGLRLQIDRPDHIRPYTSISPRFGFAYSPGAAKRIVLRGGYGMFREWVMSPIPFGEFQINRPDVTLVFLPVTGIPGINHPQTGLPLTSVDVYGSLAARGILGRRSIGFADLAALGVPPGYRFPTAGGVQQDYQPPYSQQASLQLQVAFGDTVVGIGLEGSRSAHLWRVRDHNLIVTGTRPDGWPVFGKRDPAVANTYVYESAANAFYSAMVVELERRFRGGWSFRAHYTLSRALDEVTDFNLEYQPHNQADARGDRGLSPFHQKHRFVATGIYETPATCQNNWLKRVVCGWTFSEILRANSARPFNIITGTDNLGDGQFTNHRPLGLGRNAGVGPNYISLDVRVSRTFAFGETTRLRFLVEGFNVLNRTNFRSINNVVGDVPLSALPPELVGRRGNPVQPFSFTAAHHPRQVQIGIQIAF